MKARSMRTLMALLLVLLILSAPPAHAAASLELYGTFHAMGIIVTLDGSDDPDGDATAAVAYRQASQAGEQPYRSGFPLARVADTRFVGSLFWLEQGTSYDVRVSFDDPDGHPLDGVTVTGSGATRAELAIPAPVASYHVAPGGSGKM